MADEIFIQVQCPECELWFDPDNDHDNGLVRHVLALHPFCEFAAAVDAVLLDDLLEGV